MRDLASADRSFLTTRRKAIMLGKSQFTVETTLSQKQIHEKLDHWYEVNELSEIDNNAACRTFRFGSPYFSNPIYIKVFFKERPIQIQGWVQTLVPIIRWKLINVPKESVSTKLDYRRKGGFFVSRLITALSESSPSALENEEASQVLKEPQTPHNPPKNEATEEENQNMTCPYCKEDIKEGAIKCKHCGSLLNSDNANTSKKSMPLKQFLFSLQGRIPRSVYWVNFVLPYAAIATFALLIDTALGIVDDTSTLPSPVYSLYIILALWPSIAVGVKRCHDRNRSGWFFVLLLIPVLNIWPLVELFFLKGTNGSNKFGDDPLDSNNQNILSTGNIIIKTILCSLVVIISFIVTGAFFVPENLTIEPGQCAADSYITENGLDLGFECTAKVINESDSQISQRIYADLSWDTNSGKPKTETQHIDVTLQPNTYKVETFRTLTPTAEDIDLNGNISAQFYIK